MTGPSLPTEDNKDSVTEPFYTHSNLALITGIKIVLFLTIVTTSVPPNLVRKFELNV